jgi:hypothetical protein
VVSTFFVIAQLPLSDPRSKGQSILIEELMYAYLNIAVKATIDGKMYRLALT